MHVSNKISPKEEAGLLSPTAAGLRWWSAWTWGKQMVGKSPGECLWAGAKSCQQKALQTKVLGGNNGPNIEWGRLIHSAAGWEPTNQCCSDNEWGTSLWPGGGDHQRMKGFVVTSGRSPVWGECNSHAWMDLNLHFLVSSENRISTKSFTCLWTFESVLANIYRNAGYRVKNAHSCHNSCTFR